MAIVVSGTMGKLDCFSIRRAKAEEVKMVRSIIDLIKKFAKALKAAWSAFIKTMEE